MWILILAAGNGSRMKSDLPKCLHTLHHQSFILRLMNTIHKMTTMIESIVILIQERHHSLFQKELDKGSFSIPYTFLYQDFPMKGTGHALQCFIHKSTDLPSSLIVLNGDMPNLHPKEIDIFLSKIEMDKQMAFIVGMSSELKGYGRIIMDTMKDRIIIREEKDCTEEEKQTYLFCNLGVYWFSSHYLEKHIDLLEDQNAASEFYITQLTQWLPISNIFVHMIEPSKLFYYQGINTQEELKRLQRLLKED